MNWHLLSYSLYILHCNDERTEDSRDILVYGTILVFLQASDGQICNRVDCVDDDADLARRIAENDQGKSPREKLSEGISDGSAEVLYEVIGEQGCKPSKRECILLLFGQEFVFRDIDDFFDVWTEWTSRRRRLAVILGDRFGSCFDSLNIALWRYWIDENGILFEWA